MPTPVAPRPNLMVVDLTNDSDNEDEIPKPSAQHLHHGRQSPYTISGKLSKGSEYRNWRSFGSENGAPLHKLDLPRVSTPMRVSSTIRPNSYTTSMVTELGANRLESPNPPKRRKIETETSFSSQPRLRQPESTITVFKHTVAGPALNVPDIASNETISASTPRHTYENHPLMHDVLKFQVLKHVKINTNKYSNELSSDELQRIGIVVAKRIVNKADFIPNFEDNDFALSSEYEECVKKRAELYVREIVEETSRRQAEIDHISQTDKAAFIAAIPVRPTSTKSALKKLPSQASSRSSSEDIKVDRQYSSSPTTSLSTNLADDKAEVDDENRSVRGVRHRPFENPQVTGVVRRSNTGRVGQTAAGPLLGREHNSKQVDLQRRSVQNIEPLAGRPYLKYRDRVDFKQALEGITSDEYEREELIQQFPDLLLHNHVYHVDFSKEELDVVLRTLKPNRNEKRPKNIGNEIARLLRGRDLALFYSQLRVTAKRLGQQILLTRSDEAIRAFLTDAAAGRIPSQPRILKVEAKPIVHRITTCSTGSIIREREVWGLAPRRVAKGKQTFAVESLTRLEDTLKRRSEWSDCSGDITSLVWASKDIFVFGATAHSDYHNMQYNKQGNMGYGSCSLDVLWSVPDHREDRPVIDSSVNAENALESMRQTQDPWIYTSVVSAAHCEKSSYTFTASFDKTVKVWKVTDGSLADMKAKGTWTHEAKVNFVVTSPHHDLVATACDVSNNAIRVYHLDTSDPNKSWYDTYSGERAEEQALRPEQHGKWAYFPATIAWGKSSGAKKLLLVGYSPRSTTDQDEDIPEDKKNSGELCLWNVDDQSQIAISSAHWQNVFEVIWHPSQPIFIAATSPCGHYDTAMTKTQIQLFAQSEMGTFMQIKALDCRAYDINELTIMPNTPLESYITASCTDGNTYVWDTAQGDRPIHILGHGESLANPLHYIAREFADEGVKFASWGKTSNRFYTGSSDGKVKSWDVRAPKGQAYVKTVLSVSGGVSCGTFSNDFSRLVVGDATGKVHLLEINDDDSDDDDDDDDDTMQERCIPAVARDEGPAWLQQVIPGKKPPKTIVPHRKPKQPSTSCNDEVGQTAREIAQLYLNQGQLYKHRDRSVGVLQGPNYSDTDLYCYELHEEMDSSKPLLSDIQELQQSETKKAADLIITRLPHISGYSSSAQNHVANQKQNFVIPDALREELEHDGVDLIFEPDTDFTWEPDFSKNIFKVSVGERSIRNGRLRLEEADEDESSIIDEVDVL